MSDLPNNTIADIQAMVAKAFATITAKDQDRRDAREVFDDAAKAATSVREAALITLAGAGAAGAWESNQIESAIDQAKSARNVDKKDTTLNTFAAEIRRALHPSVRSHVADLFRVARECWDAEGSLDAKATKPLRRAYSRLYHMVMASFDVTAAGNLPTSAEHFDLMAAAVLRDRELNAKRVLKRLRAIKDQLAAFAVDFPVTGIDDCCEYLGAVTIADLKACLRPSESGPATATATATEAAPMIDAKSVLSDAADDASDDAATGEPMGVSDVLEDALRDIAA